MESTSCELGCKSPTAKTGGFNRRILYIGLALAAGAGMFLGWDWLVGVGLSTFIIALLPCLVMCAVGLCAMRMGQGKSSVPPPAAQSEVNIEPRQGRN